MNPLTKFGFFLFSISSALIILLKAMTKYGIYVGSSFYNFLYSFGIVLPFILAIAFLLMVATYIKSFLVLLIGFVMLLRLTRGLMNLQISLPVVCGKMEKSYFTL